jgi:hypothetical protein
MTFSFRRSTAAVLALALAAGTVAAQAQTAAPAGTAPTYVVPEPGVVVAAGAPAYAVAYPAPVYAAPVAYVQAPAYYIDPVATVLTAVGVGLLFGIGGHHGGPGPGPRHW